MFSTIREQTQPTLGNIDIAPSSNDIGPTSQNKAKVIAEHRVRQAIDPEDPSKKLQSISNPAATMFKGLSREAIFTED